MKRSRIIQQRSVFLCLIVGLGLLSAVRCQSAQAPSALSPLEAHLATTREIVELLRHRHYRQHEVNDALSSEVFDRYIEALDPTRSHFLASDIKEFEVERFRLDDALLAADLRPAFKIYNRFHLRLTQRLKFLIRFLEEQGSGMSFQGDEVLETDRQEAPWPVDETRLHQLWEKILKSSLLSLLLADKSLPEAVDLLAKRYRDQLNRIGQTKSEDTFQVFINALAQTYDPHTQYFSPRASENFTINMSLSLEGIGALLQHEDGYTKIVRLIPAGPAEKSNKLKPADRIVGVGQGPEGEMVDVVGWRLDDVVQLIRGPKNSVVRLEVIPADVEDIHQTKTVTIVRNTVKLEEQAAKKKLLELTRDGHNYTFGIVDIPAFYLDFKAYQAGKADYKSTTRDVRRLLHELTEDRVDGLILDLRNNSGGSLQEATSLAGLFITSGPIVQVRNADGRIDIIRDRDSRIAYTGPLLIVVNRLSASASEIVAGMIQDYQRGIIMGEPTFGKGTVQSLVSLQRGQLKVTIATFYRISGESTQNRGVVPDIVYPSLYDSKQIGESALSNALPWDTIRAAPYEKFQNLTTALPLLQSRHQMRSGTDPDFTYVSDMAKYLHALRQKTRISLNESVRRRGKKDSEQQRLGMENRKRRAKGLAPIASLEEMDEDEKKEDLTDDPVLHEAGLVLVDWITRAPGALKAARH